MDHKVLYNIMSVYLINHIWSHSTLHFLYFLSLSFSYSDQTPQSFNSSKFQGNYLPSSLLGWLRSGRSRVLLSLLRCLPRRPSNSHENRSGFPADQAPG